MLRWLGFGLLLAWGPALHATGCADAANQAMLNACAGKSLQAADAELNAVYGQIRQRLKGDPDTTGLLVSAQRGWIAFRDAECAFAASGVAGGSVAPMIRAQCLDGLTRARTAQLRAYLRCEDGDMGCPVPPAN